MLTDILEELEKSISVGDIEDSDEFIVHTNKSD